MMESRFAEIKERARVSLTAEEFRFLVNFTGYGGTYDEDYQRLVKELTNRPYLPDSQKYILEKLRNNQFNFEEVRQFASAVALNKIEADDIWP